MSHIGIVSFPGTGHLNPLTALGRRLQARGHRVTFFQIADVEPAVKAAGLEYVQIGQQDYPAGTLKRLDQELGELKGFKAIGFTVNRVRDSALMTLRDAPEAMRKAGVEMLIVDQAEISGGTIAQRLGIPFVTVILFIPINLDPSVPFFGYGWKHGTTPYHRIRNRIGNAIFSRVSAPGRHAVNQRRKEWGLPELHGVSALGSPLAQITQTPAVFDFPDRKLPAHFHYTGPFSDAGSRKSVDFPWDRLDPNRPLIFASMGTLQNQMNHAFRTIAEACAGVDAQLVLSLGGGMSPEELGTVPGNPIVVKYAPQLELIRKATLVITHAGLNTTLESLSNGVPMVAIPVTNDQPGVAARIEWSGTGRAIPIKKLSVPRLSEAVRHVLGTPSYRARAAELQSHIVAANGLDRAADIVERSFGIGAGAGTSTTASVQMSAAR